jgi:hypothetical protein
MSVWKTLRQEKPRRFATVLVLTRSKRILQAFYNPEDKKFWERLGLVHPISNYLRWCYEEELVEEALKEINSDNI